MKRIELRSPMGWQLFDFWAFVIVVVLGLFLIMFSMIDWPGADQCCQSAAVTSDGIADSDKNYLIVESIELQSFSVLDSYI